MNPCGAFRDARVAFNKKDARVNKMTIAVDVHAGAFKTDAGRRIVAAVLSGQPIQAADGRLLVQSMVPTPDVSVAEFVTRVRAVPAPVSRTPNDQYDTIERIRDMAYVARRSARHRARSPSPSAISETTEVASTFSRQTFMRTMELGVHKRSE